MRARVQRTLVTAVALLPLAILGLRADPPEATSKPDPGDLTRVVVRDAEWIDLVGICPVADSRQGWSVVWHSGLPGLPLSEQRIVFRELEGDDVDRCLETLARTDRDTAALLAKATARSTNDAELYRAINRNAHAAWRKAGTEEVLREVAREGKRGAETERWLAHCGQLAPGPPPSATPKAAPAAVP